MKTKSDKDKLDSIIRKVQALLARAEHPNTPKPEADACRQKMEALMIQYRISEIGESDSGNIEPVMRRFRLCDSDSEFARYYAQIWMSILEHFDGRGVVSYFSTEAAAEDQGYGVVAESFGYESDLRFAEIMYLATSSVFGAKLEPELNPDETEAENALRMRTAGMERWRIAEALWGRDGRVKGSLHNKVGAMVRKEAAKQGVSLVGLTGKGVKVNYWRDDYAAGFQREIAMRLRMMRASRGEFEGGLVLAGRKEAIDESFYVAHPSYRPDPNPSPAYDHRAACAKCQKAKSGYCRDHQYLRPKAGSYRYRDASAMEAGRSAARTVDITNGRRSSGGRLES